MFLSLFLYFTLYILSSYGCDYSSCRNDAISHEGEWVKCDTCVCNDFESITDDNSDTCQISNEDLYECWIQQDISDGSVTWSCMPRMKTGWIIGFVFISLFGCCLCAGLISYLCKPKRNDEIKIVLIHPQI